MRQVGEGHCGQEKSESQVLEVGTGQNVKEMKEARVAEAQETRLELARSDQWDEKSKNLDFILGFTAELV